jgi:hypothetical protein
VTDILSTPTRCWRYRQAEPVLTPLADNASKFTLMSTHTARFVHNRVYHELCGAVRRTRIQRRPHSHEAKCWTTDESYLQSRQPQKTRFCSRRCDLVPKLRMSGVIPPLSCMSLWCARGVQFRLYLCLYQKRFHSSVKAEILTTVLM